MSHRIWRVGLVCCCLSLLSPPTWAQFGGGLSAGPGMNGGVGGGYPAGQPDIINLVNINGPQMSIDLKAATLGQLVEFIQSSNKPQTGQEKDSEVVSILIADELKKLSVGDVMLQQVTAAETLSAISKLTHDAFLIEVVGGGKVLILKPADRKVVVKAIHLSWMDPPAQSYVQSMSSMMGGEPETPEAYEKRLLDHAKSVEMKQAMLMETIEVVFKMHAEVSGQDVKLPKISTQGNLGMMMVVGSPESVEIATEIIEATNSGPARNRAMGGMGAGGMGMGVGLPGMKP